MHAAVNFRRMATGVTKIVAGAVDLEDVRVRQICSGHSPSWLLRQKRAMRAALAAGRPERDVFAELDELLTSFGWERARKGESTPSIRDLAMVMDFTDDKHIQGELTGKLLEVFDALERQQSAGRFLRGKRGGRS